MRLLLLIIVSLALMPIHAFEGPFKSLSFEDALKTARKDKKVVPRYTHQQRNSLSHIFQLCHFQKDNLGIGSPAKLQAQKHVIT